MMHVIKRLVEIAVASLVLLLLGQVLICIAVVIWLMDGGPILIREVWTDRQGRSTTLLAFRTERIGFDSLGARLRVQPPLPFVGSFLRAYDLDKLPRCWNVLRGDCGLAALLP